MKKGLEGRESAAETEARAGATGSDLVILPAPPLSPSTPFAHPTINPEL